MTPIAQIVTKGEVGPLAYGRGSDGWYRQPSATIFQKSSAVGSVFETHVQILSHPSNSLS